MKIRATLFPFVYFGLGVFSLMADDIKEERSLLVKDTIAPDKATISIPTSPGTTGTSHYISLEEVVISGSKTPEKRELVPSTVSVLSREEMDESSESAILPILSERIPGLFVTERGVTGFGLGSGSAGVLNIRGVGGGNKVLMLFDGQPQWAGIFGHHLPDTYVTSDAERVEVVRGPASLLYGSNAMGGIVNIITRKADEDGFYGRGRLLFGSFNTQKYMLNGGFKKNKLNVYASLNHDRTDGHRDNSKFYITNGYVKLGYDFSPHWNASGDVILAKFNSNNPGSIQQAVIDNWVDALRGTYSLSIQNNYDKVSGAIQAFYNFGHHEINDGWVNGAPRPYLFNSDDYNAGFTIYESIRLFEGNLITAGFDYKKWGGHAWNDSINGRNGEMINKDVNEAAVYALAQHTFARKWTINAGIRLEMNETYGNEWVPQAGISYQATKHTHFKMSVAKGFRSPNIRELYMFMAANPDLKPESMINYDFSVLQKLLDGKLNLELTAFYAKGKNMIQTLPTPEGTRKNINSGSFTNKGFEFAASYRISSNLRINGNYSFLHTDVPIVAAPKHQAFLNTNWKINKFTLSGSLQYVGDLYTLAETNNTQTEDYALLNAKISYRLAKWVNLFVNGDNLTDQDYSINYGFPMPGIVVMGGVDLKF